MQKVLDFLEKYCQWLAVGIAAAFFLFALWQFLPGISEPVTVPLDGQAYGPGRVDEVIRENAERLDTQVKNSATINPTVPKYAKAFESDMDAAGVQPLPPVASSAFRGSRYELPPEIKVEKPAEGGRTDGDLRVASLPVPPAAMIKSDPLGPVVSTGFSQVPADPAQNGQPNAAAAAVPAPPVQPGANGQTTVPSKDVTWVRVPYVIPMQRLRAAFGGAGIPAALSRTSVLGVDLIRQRQLAGDAWGPEEVVAKLPTVQLRDLPPNDAAIPVALDYRQWAEQNQKAILQPQFFQIVGGENPDVLRPPVTPAAAAIFDPTTFPPNGNLNTLTPEQRAAVMAERRRVAQEAAQQRRQNRPQQQPRGGRMPQGADMGEYMPQEALPQSSRAGLTRPMQYRPGMRPNNSNPDIVYDPSMDGMDGMGMDGMGGMPSQPQPGQPITLPEPPAAPFDPTQPGLQDIEGVAYDITAEGDATYRYRVRYYLANPIYQVANAAKSPELTNQFSLVGEDPATWSEPILIAPLSHIFLAVQPQQGLGPVRFTIFRWQDGRQHRTVQTFSPGDSIGKVSDGIDFRTPWTLVEVRRDSSSESQYAVLMNKEGRIRFHTFNEDNNSEEQKRLAEQVELAQQAANAANPGVGFR